MSETYRPQTAEPAETISPEQVREPPARATGVPRRGPSSRRWWREVGWRHLVGIVAIFFALFPVLYIISAAFNPLGTVASTTVIPRDVSLVNFRDLFASPTFPFERWLLNTFIICTAVTIGQLFCSALAAYAFSRYRFRGRRLGLLALLLIQMFPQFLAAVALFIMLARVGEVVPPIGLNTIVGYALVMMGGALAQIWLLKGFLDTIPRSLDEAAIIDGASHAQVFFRVILPLLRPILAVSGLLVFVMVVNEFLLASIFLTDSEVKTVAVGLYGLISADRSGNLGVFAAGAVITAIPVVLLFLYLQRHIVSGIAAGSVKG